VIVGTGRGDMPASHAFERPPGFPCWTIGCLMRGAVRTEVRGAAVLHRAPSIAAVRPRTPYRIAAGEPGHGWSEVWIIFKPRPEWLPLLEWPEPVPGLPELTDGDLAAVMDAVVEVDRIASGPGAHRLAYADNQLERALLLARDRNPHAPHARRHPAVRAALGVIESRWHERFTVASLARAAACSESHLTHLFTAELGASPMAYLESHRIERAKHLLVSTALPVKDVAASVGFANPFHFSTRFRRHVGRSPVEWRRRPG